MCPHMPHTRERRHLFVDPDLPVPPSIALEGDGWQMICCLVAPSWAVAIHFLRVVCQTVTTSCAQTLFLTDCYSRSQANRWVRMEDETRQKWTSANRVLKNFINNDNNASQTQTTLMEPEKTNMSEVVMPRNDTKPRNRKLED